MKNHWSGMNENCIMAAESDRVHRKYRFQREQPVFQAEEGLVERVGRAKARWLRRVMYETTASSTEKCFAYAVVDHLNCVTLDCWPSQLRLAKLLDFKAEKTLQRAARGLEFDWCSYDQGWWTKGLPIRS